MSRQRTEIIPELSIVALGHAHKHDGKVLPEGATGAIVHTYRGDAGYEVEFEEP